MIEAWREVTERLYPNRPDLLARIPASADLTIAKLAKGGWIMTDTCSAARRFRRLLKAEIHKIGKEMGMTDGDIQIYEAGTLTYHRFLLLYQRNNTQYSLLDFNFVTDCWQHLRNVWFGAVVERVGTVLREILHVDLDAIHHSLRASTDIISLLLGIEKYFCLMANYAKGKVLK